MVVVAEAASPEDTMSALSRHHCDVLITDFAMPGTEPDGVQMLESLRRNYPILKIILLTANPHRALLQQALAIGVQCIIKKTSAMSDLVNAINAAAEGRRHVGHSLNCNLSEMRSYASRAENLRRLSLRETEVLRMLAAHRTLSEIAVLQQRSVAAISHQKISAMQKLGITTDAELNVFLSAGDVTP